MKVTVIFGERRIGIDDHIITLPAESFPAADVVNGQPVATLRSLVWDGASVHGFTYPGDVFNDPAMVRPFINAWTGELQKLLDGVEAAKAVDETAYQEFLAREKAAHEERVRFAALTDEERLEELQRAAATPPVVPPVVAAAAAAEAAK